MLLAESNLIFRDGRKDRYTQYPLVFILHIHIYIIIVVIIIIIIIIIIT